MEEKEYGDTLRGGQTSHSLNKSCAFFNWGGDRRFMLGVFGNGSFEPDLCIGFFPRFVMLGFKWANYRRMYEVMH